MYGKSIIYFFLAILFYIRYKWLPIIIVYLSLLVYHVFRIIIIIIIMSYRTNFTKCFVSLD